jgi:hypothetical protein
MIKINYTKPEQNETPDDICIYNLKLSDKYKHLPSFCQASLAWLKNDSTRDYQKLEKLLRELNLDTHLIAKQIENSSNSINSSNFKLCIPNREIQESNLEYVLLFSCRSKPDAIKELGLYHTSYEDNYECLSKTGCYVDSKIAENVDNFSYNSLENSNENLILKSLCKYDFVTVSGKESIDVIIQDLTTKYGKIPNKVPCGKLADKDIYALVLDGEIASPIGWVEVEVENEDIFQLIDFRTIKQLNK